MINHQKNIILTGGLGFLGSFFSKMLIKKNFNLIIIDKIKPKTLIQKEIVKECSLFKQLDISNENKVYEFYKELKLKKVSINYLINNAAIDSVPKKNQKKNHLPSVKIWDKEIGVSLTGSYLMIKYFGEDMSKRNFGKIVNIGSDLSVIAPNQKIYSDFENFLKPVTYSVIKHGQFGLTKYFASLYAKNNVQVNMLSPGPIFNNQKPSFVKKLKNIIPMNRMANREDLKATLLFMLNKENNYLTGQNIIVDGGRTII